MRHVRTLGARPLPWPSVGVGSTSRPAHGSTVFVTGERMISQERLRELLDYNPDTGILTRKVRTSNRIMIGDPLGSLRPDGYLQATVGGKLELVHRIVFMFLFGYLPDEVDHINGVHTDNRALNLRAATKTTNQHNRRVRKDSASGVKNVQFNKDAQAWRVRIRDGNKRHFIGDFKDLDEACLAATVAAEKHHKEFAHVV